MNKITTSTFLEYRFLSNPRFSPNGEHLAFVVQQADLEKNGYVGDIHLLTDQGPRRLTTGGDAKEICWTPGQTILFSANRGDERQKAREKGEVITTYYEVCPVSGEVKPAFTLPVKAKKLTWLGGDLYGFEGEYHLDASTAELRLRKWEDEQTCHVFEDLPFWDNVQGITSGLRSVLYTYDRKTGEVKAVSPKDMNLIRWSNQGTKLIYSAADFVGGVQNRDVHIYTYDALSGEEKLILKPGRLILRFCEVFGVLWGDKVLLVGSEGKTYGYTESPSFWLCDPETGEIELFKEYRYGIDYRSVGNDARLGAGQGMKVVGDRVYFISTVNYGTYVRFLDRDGNISDLLTPHGCSDSFDIHGDRLVYCGFYGDRLAEIYENGKQLTHFNDALFENLSVVTPKHRPFVNSAGVEIDAWCLEPAGYEKGKKYPAILHIHGGPRSLTGDIFHNEQEVWANAGYFVFFSNPRGSEGKGDAFADVWGAKRGEDDYNDLMEVADHLLSVYPDADPENFGVTGGSYGGFMTNWIIGRTDRFKCACTQRCTSNWISGELTGDNGYYYVPNNMHATTLDNPEALWGFSPLKYAKNFKTPTLVLQSDEDYCCWMDQGLQMYSALRLNGCETRLVLFHGESHDLCRNGRPKARVRRMDEIVRWMDHYLKPEASR